MCVSNFDHQGVYTEELLSIWYESGGQYVSSHERNDL